MNEPDDTSTAWSDAGGDPYDADAPGTDNEVDLFAVWTKRIREGDRDAFESLFRALHPRLIRFATKLCRDENTAADLVQEAFIRVWRTRERLDAGRSIRSLLFTSVRNLSLNLIRDTTNRRELMEKGSPPMPARRDADTRQIENEFRTRLEGWIDALPPRQREALRLTRFEGLDHAEAAEVMGCSPRTVNNHLVIALRSLREKIGEHAPELVDR